MYISVLVGLRDSDVEMRIVVASYRGGPDWFPAYHVFGLFCQGSVSSNVAAHKLIVNVGKSN